MDIDRYGPVALVAGASEGLGRAFAESLAESGFSLVMLARRPDPLDAAAAAIRERFDVDVHAIPIDLASEAAVRALPELIAELDIGLFIYNAAYAPVGPFLSRPVEDLLRIVDVNVRGPLLLTRLLAPRLVARGRGGVVLMSSLAGLQGTPRLATYAATKAFNIVLGESLWGELRPYGVDVLVSCAGAVRTPGFAAQTAGADPPGTLDACDVARATLAAVGRDPRVVPGWLNKLAQWVVGRLLPRRHAVALMEQNTRRLS